MEDFNQLEPGSSDRIEQYAVWGRYALITIAILTIIFLLSSVRREESDIESRALSRIMFGDYYVKVTFFSRFLRDSLPGGQAIAQTEEQSKRMALREYRRASRYPVPAAIRRYAVYREYLGRDDALSELRRLTSSQVLKNYPDTRTADLKAELQMWEDIYGRAQGSVLEPETVERYETRMEKLNLGPMRPIALSRLYEAAGNRNAAENVLAQAAQKYALMMFAMFFLGGLLLMSGIVGVGLLAGFVVNRRKLFADAESRAADCERIQHPVLWLSFLAYMVAFLVMSIAVGIAAAPVIENAPQDRQVLYLLGAQLAASVLSGMAGLGSLIYLTRITGGDLCAIGLTARGLASNIWWGVMGYAALLPILGLTALISNLLFKGSGGGSHPIVPMLLSGGWLSKVAILILASVLAPFFEETFFRGVLYSALRAKLGVAAAVGVSAAAFAIVHPQLPAGFLPILAIGLVFGVLFEVRRSLVPSMVAHALNNTIVLLITILGFAS